MDLDKQGDPIYAGMSDAEILVSVPRLMWQQGWRAGHFYYVKEGKLGAKRRDDLATELKAKGLK